MDNIVNTLTNTSITSTMISTAIIITISICITTIVITTARPSAKYHGVYQTRLSGAWKAENSIEN